MRHQILEQIFVGLGIDLALENLAGAGNRQGGDLTAQFFARPVHFLFDFGIGRCNNAFTFSARGFLGLFNDLGSTLLSLVDNVLSLLLGFVQNFRCLLLSLLFLMRTAFSCGKTIGYFLFALVQRIHNRWPHELHAEPHEYDERNRLAYES